MELVDQLTEEFIGGHATSYHPRKTAEDKERPRGRLRRDASPTQFRNHLNDTLLEGIGKLANGLEIN
jgi:hypothetical protein